MIRSILAILAGIVTLTITSFAIEAVADPLMMRLSSRAAQPGRRQPESPCDGLSVGLHRLVRRSWRLRYGMARATISHLSFSAHGRGPIRANGLGDDVVVASQRSALAQLDRRARVHFPRGLVRRAASRKASREKSASSGTCRKGRGVSGAPIGRSRLLARQPTLSGRFGGQSCQRPIRVFGNQ